MCFTTWFARRDAIKDEEIWGKWRENRMDPFSFLRALLAGKIARVGLKSLGNLNFNLIIVDLFCRLLLLSYFVCWYTVEMLFVYFLA